jgi:hypothetical protein
MSTNDSHEPRKAQADTPIAGGGTYLVYGNTTGAESSSVNGTDGLVNRAAASVSILGELPYTRKLIILSLQKPILKKQQILNLQPKTRH